MDEFEKKRMSLIKMDEFKRKKDEFCHLFPPW
jgi:hypothetical protein